MNYLTYNNKLRNTVRTKLYPQGEGAVNSLEGMHPGYLDGNLTGSLGSFWKMLDQDGCVYTTVLLFVLLYAAATVAVVPRLRPWWWPYLTPSVPRLTLSLCIFVRVLQVGTQLERGHSACGTPGGSPYYPSDQISPLPLPLYRHCHCHFHCHCHYYAIML